MGYLAFHWKLSNTSLSRAKQYSAVQGNTMPEPKSMLEVTIEANNLVSLASAKELYMAR